jgi:hypothetical protein
MTLAPLLSSERADWNTPANVLDLVRQVAPIELDPCSNEGSIVGATVEYRHDCGQDGLALGWGVRGLAFVNPGYGRGIGAWVEKCAAVALQHCDTTEIIALLPARPDTAWWQEHVVTADAVCFWRGRLTFLGAPHPAPFPSALAFWSGRCERVGRFEDVFNPHGWVVRP